tara:strand:+ start:1726 stop:2127 length:402 start_codon:yes stop_codon:yes gene_type:complete
MSKFFSSELDKNIITFTVLKGSPTREEWDVCKKNILEWYDYLENNNIKAGLIFNLQELVYINPNYLIEWKQLFITNGERTRKNIIGSAIIVDSDIIRQVLNLFFKIYDPIRPTRIVKNIQEAKNFITENSVLI